MEYVSAPKEYLDFLRIDEDSGTEPAGSDAGANGFSRADLDTPALGRDWIEDTPAHGLGMDETPGGLGLGATPGLGSTPGLGLGATPSHPGATPYLGMTPARESSSFSNFGAKDPRKEVCGMTKLFVLLLGPKGGMLHLIRVGGSRVDSRDISPNMCRTASHNVHWSSMC